MSSCLTLPDSELSSLDDCGCNAVHQTDSFLSSSSHPDNSVFSETSSRSLNGMFSDPNTSSISLENYSLPIGNSSVFSLSINDNKRSELSIGERCNNQSLAAVLLVSNNYVINQESGYQIVWNTGFINDDNISVSTHGVNILFYSPGKYRFEFSGNILPFTHTNITLQILSDEIMIPCEKGAMLCNNLSTTINIKANQVIIVRLIPIPLDSIVVMAGTKLNIIKCN